jgi:hypothetical protein
MEFCFTQFASTLTPTLHAGLALASPAPRQPAAVLIPNLATRLELVTRAAKQLAFRKFCSQIFLTAIPSLGNRELLEFAAHMIELQVVGLSAPSAVPAEQFDHLDLSRFVTASIIFGSIPLFGPPLPVWHLPSLASAEPLPLFN